MRTLTIAQLGLGGWPLPDSSPCPGCFLAFSRDYESPALSRPPPYAALSPPPSDRMQESYKCPPHFLRGCVFGGRLGVWVFSRRVLAVSVFISRHLPPLSLSSSSFSTRTVLRIGHASSSVITGKHIHFSSISSLSPHIPTVTV